MSRTVFLCSLLVLGTFAHSACKPQGDAPAPSSAQAAMASALSAGSPAPPAGPRAEGEAFLVELVPPANAKPGEAATARVVVTARGPYHVNKEYPMSFRPDATAAAAFAGEKIALGEGAERTACTQWPAESCTVSAPLGFTAKEAGEARLAGTVAFSVCNPERCLIEKASLAVTVAAR